MSEPAIREVLRAQVKAWNCSDLLGFCEHLDEDTVYLSGSKLIRGRAAVTAHYRSKYPNPAAMGELSVEVCSVVVQGALATVVLRFSVCLDDETQRGHGLLSFRRRAGRWWLFQDATVGQ